MKNYVISILYSTCIMIILTLFLSILYYFNIINDKVKDILIYFISIVSIFIGSYKYSKKASNKGIINGLLYYLFWIIIMIFLSTIIFKNFTLSKVIYYLILLIFSIAAGIIGKNQKKEE